MSGCVDDSFRPALRPEVRRLDEGGNPALDDPVFERTLELGPISVTLAEQLDGRTSLAALLDRAASRHPSSPRAEIEAAFRGLLLANLIEGEDSRAVAARVERAREAGAADAHVVPGSRFACQGSGACCQNYALGPLTAADRRAIDSLDVESQFPDLGPGPYYEERPSDDGESWYLKQRGERCIFLRPDHRCGIHAAFGGEKKPGLCRIYPLTWSRTVDGLMIYDGGECASFAASARSGPSLQHELPRLLALLPKRTELFHPLVYLDPMTPCDYSHYAAIQRAVGRLLAEAPGSASDRLRAMGCLVRECVDALVSCPLRDGEPRATLEPLLWRAPASWYRPAAPSAEGLRAIAAVAQDALGALAAARDAIERRFANIAGVVIRNAHAAIESKSADRADLDRIEPEAADRAEIEEVLLMSLRHAAFGHRLLVRDCALPAMLRLCLAHLVTILGAKLGASQRGAPRWSLLDLSASHHVANRVLRRSALEDVFLRHEAATWPVLDSFTALLEAR